MTILTKAKYTWNGWKLTIKENLTKVTDKAERFIQETTSEIEDSFEQVEDAAEDVWHDAKHFVEDAKKTRK